mgnify:CR=1 FL=1
MLESRVALGRFGGGGGWGRKERVGLFPRVHGVHIHIEVGGKDGELACRGGPNCRGAPIQLQVVTGLGPGLATPAIKKIKRIAQQTKLVMHQSVLIKASNCDLKR